MWPPSPAADGNTNINTKTKARLASSSSSSSSSSSLSSSSSASSFSCSPSSSSSVAVLQTPKRKTMEEVWKDMNLATLTHENQTPAAASGDTRHFFRGMILQDFLASAFKSPPSSAVSSDLPQLPLPATALSLSSGLCGPVGPSSLPRHAAASSPFSLSAKKHPLEDAPSCNAEGDRHHKRMMKNRESAARSRARKQAYTNELELEVAHRAEENAKLKKQNEEVLRTELQCYIYTSSVFHFLTVSFAYANIQIFILLACSSEWQWLLRFPKRIFFTELHQRHFKEEILMALKW